MYIGKMEHVACLFYVLQALSTQPGSYSRGNLQKQLQALHQVAGVNLILGSKSLKCQVMMYQNVQH